MAAEAGEDIGVVLERLALTVRSRAGADPAVSYTARLLGDPATAAKKFGEEAVETLLAAAAQGRERVVEESADLLYHWLVLLESRNVALSEVAAALARREGRSGLDEKASRAP